MLTSGTSAPAAEPSAFSPSRLPKTVRSCASEPTGRVSMRKGEGPAGFFGSVSSLLRAGAICARVAPSGKAPARTESASSKRVRDFLFCRFRGTVFIVLNISFCVTRKLLSEREDCARPLPRESKCGGVRVSQSLAAQKEQPTFHRRQQFTRTGEHFPRPSAGARTLFRRPVRCRLTTPLLP